MEFFCAAPRRRLVLLFILFPNAVVPQQDENGPKMYDIQPRGGPVLGGTRMTVLGESLTGLDCVLGDATPEDELDPILAAQGLDGRFRTPCAPSQGTGSTQYCRCWGLGCVLGAGDGSASTA